MMDDPNLAQFPDLFADPLLAFCELPEPNLAFVAALELRLQKQQTGFLQPIKTTGANPSSVWRMLATMVSVRKWQYALVFIFVILAVALFAIGPQRVLAQVQQWLGYLPGMGFVDLKQARILAAPASVQQQGVTLQVEQALAEPDRTLVVISSQGLPAEKVGASLAGMEAFSKAALRLPDGRALEAVRQDLSYGGGKIQFPALPEGVDRVTLEIDRLPLLPPGAAPEGRQVPLLFRRAAGELPADLFPQPYEPVDASAAVNGVTARILQVAQSAQETALQVRFEWENQEWAWQAGTFPPELRDDLGNTYHPLNPNTQAASILVQEAESIASPPVGTGSTAPSGLETYRFPALAPGAREAVFALPFVEFSLPDIAAFTFNPGPNPQLGQTWNLDEAMEVAGIPLHLVGARLSQDHQTYIQEPEPLYSLELVFHSPAGLPRSLSVFSLGTDLEGYRGGGGGSPEPGVYKMTMLFKQLPQKPLQITIERARIALQGPWEIHWQIPWSGEAPQPSISRISPDGVEETHAGVTLQVAEASFDSRVSVVQLATPGLPAGSRLLNVLGYDPAQASLFAESQLYLEDPRGKRIGLAQGVTRPPADAAQEGPGRLVFGPVSPLPDRITLHVPAVELFITGQAAFEVDVPAGLDLPQRGIQGTGPRPNWRAAGDRPNPLGERSLGDRRPGRGRRLPAAFHPGAGRAGSERQPALPADAHQPAAQPRAGWKIPERAARGEPHPPGWQKPVRRHGQRAHALVWPVLRSPSDGKIRSGALECQADPGRHRSQRGGPAFRTLPGRARRRDRLGSGTLGSQLVFGQPINSTLRRRSEMRVKRLVMTKEQFGHKKGSVIAQVRFQASASFPCRIQTWTHSTDIQRSIQDAHNADNRWQQAFRVGYLDLVALRYALRVIGKVDGLVITNLDRIAELQRAIPEWQACNSLSIHGCKR